MRDSGYGIREQIQGTGSAVRSDEWRVDRVSPAPRFPSLAPSQCPRHSPTSFIGGSGEEDEGIFFGGEPQRGDLTKPRATPWVNGTRTDTRALKGRNNPFNPTRADRRGQFRACPAIAVWRYLALSGLAAKFGGNLNPGLQSAIRIGGLSAWALLFRPVGAQGIAWEIARGCCLNPGHRPG